MNANSSVDFITSRTTALSLFPPISATPIKQPQPSAQFSRENHYFFAQPHESYPREITPEPTSGKQSPQPPETSFLNSRALAYSVGRLPYPREMIKKIREIIGRKAWVLDIGTGPGRSAIPLRQYCTSRIVGLDWDPEMKAELARNSRDAGMKIPCKLGQVRDLLTLFPHKRFDAITAFSSLTLFDDDASIQAIRSVLTPSGVFIDAGDEGAKVDVMGKIMRDVIAKALNLQLKTGHDGREHNEEEALKRNGFEPYLRHRFVAEERYTFEEALANFKSRITYPKCSNEDQQKITATLREYFDTVVKGDTIRFPVAYKLTVYRIKSTPESNVNKPIPRSLL